MPRKWLRLIASVGLVAFFAANVHAGAPLEGRLLAALSPARQAPQPARPFVRAAEDGAPATRPTSCCKRCAKKPRKATPPTSVAAPDSPAVSERGPCPCGPSCPDGPNGRSCPCPGGCAFCNVAKVPCLAPAAPFLFASPCLGDSLPQAAPLYTPPFASRLVRPPRA